MPRVKEVDMLHAQDYSEMSLDELNSTLDSTKEKDVEIREKIR